MLVLYKIKVNIFSVVSAIKEVMEEIEGLLTELKREQKDRYVI